MENKIKIIKNLGSSCSNCQKLEAHAKQAVQELNLSNVWVERIYEIDKIAEYGIISTPAINIAAIFLTMSVLGFKIGLARIIDAVLLSILVGLSTQLIFREKVEEWGIFTEKSKDVQINEKLLGIFIGAMVGILVVNGL
jgi:hypothetical protein